MKIKCDDGIVREFQPCVYDGDISWEALCLECGYEFGIHDTKVLKPEFKKHICKCKDPSIKEEWNEVKRCIKERKEIIKKIKNKR